MTATPAPSRIFISYKRENEAFAKTLRQRLIDGGYSVWMDIFDIPAGAHWPDEIQKGLEWCEVVLGVMTPLAMESRNVKNEWDWAIVYDRRFIPLMVETCTVHMNYVSFNYIDFRKGHDFGFGMLDTALKSAPASTDPDQYRDYLQALYERINAYLARAIIRLSDDRNEAEPIRLESERSEGMVDALFEKRDEVDPLFEIGFGDAPEAAPTTFTDFNAAYEHFDGRLLLLGEPGAGKTITLLHFGRDAVVRRMQDSTQPLPILATIPTWNIVDAPPLIEWLAASFGAPSNVRELILDGKTLLLLDGLDELGGERKDPTTGETIPDPRPRFMDALRALPANNRVIVTCRVADYAEIGQKIALNGALTLRALADAQIRDYLRDLPELWMALESDDQLRDVTRTPILLSYFAFGYKEASESDRQLLKDLSAKDGDERFYELRAAIFERYVRGRYEHEARKMKARGEQMEFTLEEIEIQVGQIAAHNINRSFFTKANLISLQDVERITGTKSLRFIFAALRLHLVIHLSKESFRFPHILLRDYFAYKIAIITLHDGLLFRRSIAVYVLSEIRDIRSFRPLIDALHYSDMDARFQAAHALGNIGDIQAVEPLIIALRDSNAFVRGAAASALGNIGDVRAVEPLITALLDSDWDVQHRAVNALGEIGDIRAIKPLIALLNNRGFSHFYASDALILIGTPEALEAVRQWEEEQRKTSGASGDDDGM